MQATRSFIFTLAVLTLLISACSQTPEDLTAPTLEPQFGTRGLDSVDDVAYNKAGHLYAVGVWNGTYEYDSESRCDVYNQDAYIRRYDHSGSMLWETLLEVDQAYETAQHTMRETSVATDSSGNAFMAWSVTYTNEPDYNSSSRCFNREFLGTFNYLSKYSPSGKKLWRVPINDVTLHDLATDSSGNVYVGTNTALAKYTSSGTRSWTRTVLSGASGVAVSSTNNVYVVSQYGSVIKYNSSGTQLFTKTSALDSESWNYKIAAGLDNEVYVTGELQTFHEDSCEGTLNVWRYTMRVYKLNSSGTRQWYRDAATGTYTEGYCDIYGEYNGDTSGNPGRLNLATDRYGNVYLAGYRNGTSGDQDAFAAKYTRAGGRSWVKGFGTAKDDGATAIATYDGSEVFLGGVTEGYLVHRPLGPGDAFLREMNSSGNQVWTR